jgi:hypothetical protein
VIALRVADATGSLDATLAWLRQVQNDDGGWGDVPGSPSTADGTGAVMQAMPETETAKHGLGYLRDAQRPNGGFPLGGSGKVNAQSTAWAVQGMLAVGADPASVSGGGDNALEYLGARQDPDGHYRYSASSDQTPIWVTGQVLAAVAGEPFPVTPVPRKAQPTTKQPALIPGIDPSLAPPPAETGSAQSPLESLGGGSTTAPPATGGSGSAAKPPATGGIPGLPPSGTNQPEGAEPETSSSDPAAPLFEAGDNPGPEPWAPLAVGLGAAGLALGSVLFLGRRFGW